MTVSRRELLKILPTIVLVEPAVGLAEAGRQRGLANAGQAKTNSLTPPTPLSDRERSTLAAAVDRLLPGAADAGVPEYISYWLAMEPFQGLRRFIGAGLGYLDKLAEKRFKKNFNSSAPDEKDALLKKLAAETPSPGRFNGRLFFQKLMELTLEGYLSDPKYGGNRNRVGWRFIGIPDGLGSCWWNPNGVQTITDPESGFQD
jgi:hypothetical protein